MVDLLHAATIAVTAEVTLDQLWHAVPVFPNRPSEIWLNLWLGGHREITGEIIQRQRARRFGTVTHVGRVGVQIEKKPRQANPQLSNTEPARDPQSCRFDTC